MAIIIIIFKTQDVSPTISEIIQKRASCWRDHLYYY